jgi:DNA-binding NarL/FixJ family response regulator
VLKTQVTEDLLRAIREVSRGEVYLSAGVAASVVDAYLDKKGETEEPLTARERQVLQLVVEGHTTKEAAKLLGIAFKTAESHRNHIMKKLGIHDVVALMRYAIEAGLVRI